MIRKFIRFIGFGEVLYDYRELFTRPPTFLEMVDDLNSVLDELIYNCYFKPLGIKRSA